MFFICTTAQVIFYVVNMHHGQWYKSICIFPVQFRWVCSRLFSIAIARFYTIKAVSFRLKSLCWLDAWWGVIVTANNALSNCKPVALTTFPPSVSIESFVDGLIYRWYKQIYCIYVIYSLRKEEEEEIVNIVLYSWNVNMHLNLLCIGVYGPKI